MKLSLVSASLLAGLVVVVPGRASDHIDGIKTAIDPSADLTDVFAFVSPADRSKVVLIMNVDGTASKRSRFSNAVDYTFRIRPIEDAKTLTPSADPKKEQKIVCNFSGGLPLVDAMQTATCVFNLGETPEKVTFQTRGGAYQAGGDAAQNGFRVFAGARSDPWFLDLKRTVHFSSGLPVDKTPGKNGLDGKNVLSIVVEVDKARLPTLFAVNAQTVRK